MKNLLFITFIMFCSVTYGQDKIVFVEITDTVEVAYDVRYDGWEQQGFNYVMKTVRDSVGLDSIKIFRFYTYLPHISEKIYLDLDITKYITEPKGSDYRNSLW